MRVSARTARSRFTREFWTKEPRFVRRRVSGAMPTVNVPEEEENVVTVRQVPFMLMLSPSWQSCRMEEAEEIVSWVPPSEDWGLSCVTSLRKDVSISVVLYVDYGGAEGQIRRDEPPIISTIPVNILDVCAAEEMV